MKETIEQIKTLLADIFKRIEHRLELEQVDLKKFDESLEDNKDEDENEIDLRKGMLRLRERIEKSKADNSFWKNDIPDLILLLETSKEKIQGYRDDLTEIGGKDLPSDDIIQIIKQRILTRETPISKTHKGKEFIGHLTEDGYLKLKVYGITEKLPLRKAAICAWKSNPSNAWTFWEAPDKNGEKKPLEYFRNLLA